MAHLMPKHGLKFLTVHIRKYLVGNGDKRTVPERTGGKCVRRTAVYRHLRHLYVRRSRKAFDRIHQPTRIFAFRAVHDLRTRRPLCHRLRHEKRDESPSHAEDKREHAYREVVYAILVQGSLNLRPRKCEYYVQHDAERQYHRHVHQHEKHHSLHYFISV